MSSWIYLFSKFTPEALLFEALGICVLTATYTGFWVLQKRRLGAVRHEVPAGLVKGYLNELITDAEGLRAQLFGLLAAAGMPAGTAMPSMAAYAAPAPTPAASADPELARKLAAFESKMAEQTRAMEAILADKTKLERDLADARAAGGAKAGAPSPEVPKLQEKIQALEGRLAEYSVIEDDLANLKRLQQENAQLRAQLSAKGNAPAPAAAAPAPAPAPAPAATAPTPPAAAAKAPAAPVDIAVDASSAFEGLVDQVEASLQDSGSPLDAALGDIEGITESEPALAAAAAAPAAPAPAAAASAVAATTDTTPQKTDEDLVAEFEKMLNS